MYTGIVGQGVAGYAPQLAKLPVHGPKQQRNGNRHCEARCVVIWGPPVHAQCSLQQVRQLANEGACVCRGKCKWCGALGRLADSQYVILQAPVMLSTIVVASRHMSRFTQYADTMPRGTCK